MPGMLLSLVVAATVVTLTTYPNRLCRLLLELLGMLLSLGSSCYCRNPYHISNLPLHAAATRNAWHATFAW